MLEIAPFTIEELKDLPFTAKAIEQLKQETIMKGKLEVRRHKRSYIRKIWDIVRRY